MRPEEREARKARVVEMRLAGLSRSQICRALELKSDGRALDRWLEDVPPPEWTKRPRAKDDLREKAVAMRLEGHSYTEIRDVPGVSKSTLSLWLRGVPLTAKYTAATKTRNAAAARKRAILMKARSRARDLRIASEAKSQVRDLTKSRTLCRGVVAYWAEGAKSKPWRRGERVQFATSDPQMVVLFLRWLELLGVARNRITFRVAIHERADVASAVRFWANLVGVPASSFHKTTLKRHNPRTVRKNVGDDYHGCLTIRVRKSTELNRRIEGWFQGIVANLPESNHAY